MSFCSLPHGSMLLLLLLLLLPHGSMLLHGNSSATHQIQDLIKGKDRRGMKGLAGKDDSNTGTATPKKPQKPRNALKSDAANSMKEDKPGLEF